MAIPMTMEGAVSDAALAYGVRARASVTHGSGGVQERLGLCGSAFGIVVERGQVLLVDARITLRTVPAAAPTRSTPCVDTSPVAAVFRYAP